MTRRSRAAAVAALVLVAIAGGAILVRRPATDRSTVASTAIASTVITTASGTPRTATPSATPSAEDEVSAVYLESWVAYARAVGELDPSGLDAVMTGPMLDRTRAEIADLRQQGHAARIVVDHHSIARVDAAAGTATVVDEYVNRSYLVSAKTGQPIGAQPPPNTVADTFFLVREGEQWKVQDSVRTVIQ